MTQYGRTIDLAAPGEGNWAVCAPAVLRGCRNFQSPPQPTDLQSFGGTSESAPLTAGVAALVIQAYRIDATTAPRRRRRWSRRSSPAPPTTWACRRDEQGAGLLDARAAVEAALTYPAAAPAAGQACPSHLVTVDRPVHPGRRTRARPRPARSRSPTSATKPMTVQRAGPRRSRRSPRRRPAARVRLAPRCRRSPTTNGQTWAHKKVTFTVPPGTDRLLSPDDRRSRPRGPQDIVRLTLLGAGRHVRGQQPPAGWRGDARTTPTSTSASRSPGTWTAVLYSLAGATGTTGADQAARSTASTQSGRPGQPRPAFMLAPGQSQAGARPRLPTPANSGDTDYSVTFADSAGSGPRSRRSCGALIDDPLGRRLLGGDDHRWQRPRRSRRGRRSATASTCRAGKRDLDVSMKLAKRPGRHRRRRADRPERPGRRRRQQHLLRTPAAPVHAVDGHPDCSTPRRSPAGGGWSSWCRTRSPAPSSRRRSARARSGSSRSRPARPGLPHSSSVTLPKGAADDGHSLHFTNNGVEPLVPRSRGSHPETVQALRAIAVQGDETITLPQDPTDAPTYLLPPETSRFATRPSSARCRPRLEIQNSSGRHRRHR